MEPIICGNNLETIINKIQDYILENRILGGIRLVDYSNDEIVILVDEKPIDQEVANIWWSGYKAALQ